jgi:hypothetical protein
MNIHLDFDPTNTEDCVALQKMAIALNDGSMPKKVTPKSVPPKAAQKAALKNVPTKKDVAEPPPDCEAPTPEELIKIAREKLHADEDGPSKMRDLLSRHGVSKVSELEDGPARSAFKVELEKL